MTTVLAGVDIGGTKCAVTLAATGPGAPAILGKRRFATPPAPAEGVARLVAELGELAAQLGVAPAAIGVSCGSPLDSARGLILAPPNLASWERVDIFSPLREAFGAPVALQNDANACALAEWAWGAGRGLSHVVFLTFGTGMGAGLVLNGRLYSGASDMAGEVGHIRLAQWGPAGCGKPGSFEGFCSGTGIARLARDAVEAEHQGGKRPAICPRPEDLPALTAERVGQAAQAGDPLALAVFELVARKLGEGLAIIVDLLNPERIVIGSIYGRQLALLEEGVARVLAAECLPQTLAACSITPAGLGEAVGDYGALAVANELLRG